METQEAVPVGNVMSDVIGAMVEELQAGATVKTVARKYKTTYEYTRKLAHAHGVPLRRGARKGMGWNQGTGLSPALVMQALQLDSNMSEVARNFGVSREYIRQIAKNNGYIFHNSKVALRRENEALLAPIIDFVKAGLCHQCRKQPMDEKHKTLGLCAVCFTRRRYTSIVISRIRDYIRSGNTRSLSQAAWTVREYGITLEDIRRY